MAKTIKAGPLSLLTTIILVCLAILAVLTYSTSNATLAQSERQTARVQAYYDLDAQGQVWLADVKQAVSKAGGVNGATLPEGSQVSGSQVSTVLSGSDLQKLQITVDVSGTTCTVVQWKSSVEWQAERDWGGLRLAG